eukprot:gene2092-1048_t
MRAALTVPMMEAATRDIAITADGATPEGAEGMLEFMYTAGFLQDLLLCTKQLPDGADPLLVLPLAHFYGLGDLTQVCAERSADGATGGNIARTRRVLNKYRDADACVASAWEKVLGSVAGTGGPNTLLRSLLADVLTR